jgi:hypothetical protein
MNKDLEKQINKQLQGNLTDKQWKYFKTLCKHQLIELDTSALDRNSPFMTARFWFDIGWRAKKVIKARKKEQADT